MKYTTTTDKSNDSNSGDSVVKNTQLGQSATDTSTIDTPRELGYNDIVFANLIAKGMTPTTAYRQAYPSKSKLAYNTVRQYAMQLCQDMAIIKEVEIKKQTLARLARLAEDRIEEVLTEGKMGSKAVTDVSLAMYEHANGKATQRTELISKSVSVNIDLTSNVTDIQ